MSVLNHPVLELNKNWQAIGTCTVREAICKIMASKACIIHRHNDVYTPFTWNDWSQLEIIFGDRVITSATAAFRVPDIILHTEYDKVPKPKTCFSRRSIFKRDRYSCMYCGVRPEASDLSIDHVLPRSQGGLTTWENCVACCLECNSYKRNRTPAEAKMTLIKEPIKPKNKPIFIKDSHHKYIANWRDFVSECYWSCELENDNKD